ncbi:hypothetical protein MAQA_00165 [Listeria aquatica FSL S10-1188]|uniref:HTH tetR-type domain-containing protein n=1 Tax=Listeria aquatica FSL S10-1188 TaxID=1265818 RepID=W7BAT9_9LIST|nr:hypothetical protein MAQA_00165 [Listeria aquatica FSL S10-1188]
MIFSLNFKKRAMEATMTTKEKIIESAISVIQSEGTANYSLAKVAEKTGMTKAAIFYYF